ncbi:MAG TPA: DUF3097 domain-containing protein [Trebonia sp.]
MRSRQYGRDVLAASQRRRGQGQGPVPQVEASPGLVIEDFEGRFCGAVTGFEKDAVTLEDSRGKRRAFPLPGTFLLEGQRVTLVRPKSTPGDQSGGGGRDAGGGRGVTRTRRTASGSIAAPVQRAKVARASRIYVEGKHDAELVEKVWGDDLRDVGVVVEYLEGVDDLPAIVRAFQPGPGRRLGVLVDHLVDGSKESRIAAAARSPHVLVVGHPFIDIWAAVKPAAVGLSAWPDVPPGQPWKEGVLRAAGWPAADTPGAVAAAWRRILRSVDSYADLDSALLGRVEELIDFVTAAEDGYR